MNKIKERLKNVGFWVSLAGSVMLMLGAFGVDMGGETVSAVINGISSFLVVCGIVSDPTTGTGYLDGVSDMLGGMDTPVAAAIKKAIDGADKKRSAENDGATNDNASPAAPEKDNN